MFIEYESPFSISLNDNSGTFLDIMKFYQKKGQYDCPFNIINVT